MSAEVDRQVNIIIFLITNNENIRTAYFYRWECVKEQSLKDPDGISNILLRICYHQENSVDFY